PAVSAPVANAKTEVGSGKKMTGYNFYISSRMAELKKENTVPSGDRMAKAIGEWKQMKETEKKVYKDKVGASVATSGAKAVKGDKPKKLTDYQQFVKTTMPQLKKDGVKKDHMS